MDDQNTQPPLTPSPATPPTLTPPKASHTWLYIILVLALAASLVAAGLAWSYSQAKKDNASLTNELTALRATTHELPAGAVKLSECIPNMGLHYLAPGGDAIYGPFLLVNKANKVIGVEYMASADMYTPIPDVIPPVEVLTLNSPLYGWAYDHSEISRAPEGHEGFLEDHIDVHLYTVSPEEQKNACGE